MFNAFEIQITTQLLSSAAAKKDSVPRKESPTEKKVYYFYDLRKIQFTEFYGFLHQHCFNVFEAQKLLFIMCTAQQLYKPNKNIFNDFHKSNKVECNICMFVCFSLMWNFMLLKIKKTKKRRINDSVFFFGEFCSSRKRKL